MTQWTIDGVIMNSIINCMQYLLSYNNAIIWFICRFMGFMTNVWENMAMPMCGNISLTCLIICHSQLWWTVRSSVCTVDCHPVLTPWTTSEHWTDCRRCHMRVPCVTCSGLTLMTEVAGEYLPEVLATLLVRTSQRLLITAMDWLLSQGYIITLLMVCNS